MIKDKQDVKPFLIRIGVAIAVSFAGFLFARSRTRRGKDQGNEDDVEGGRFGQMDNTCRTRKTFSSRSISSNSIEKHEDIERPKVAVDYCMSDLSPGNRQSEYKDGYLLPEFNEIVKQIDFAATAAGMSPQKNAETAMSDVEDSRGYQGMEKDVYEWEIEHLRNLVALLRERERSLEVQLLEFYGLKEQEIAFLELQNRLKLKIVEVKHLTLKIEAMKSDNQRLQAQIADHAKTAAELDAARSDIKLLKRRLRRELEQNKEKILILQKQVAMLLDQELRAASESSSTKKDETDSDIQLNSRRLKILEGEAEELRKSNLTLSKENKDLACQLESTQILANSVLEDPEIQESRERVQRLREENEELTKEVERLKVGRCKDAEELVYLRWINACLRYELRNFLPPHGKTIARDLSKSLSPRSEEKAKKLILEYARTESMDNDICFVDFETAFWSSSQASFVADSGDRDDSSFKTNSSGKIKIFNKLRRLLRGKEENTNRHHHSSHTKSERPMEVSDSPPGSSSVSIVTDATSEHLSNRLQIPSLSSSRRSRNSVDINITSNSRMDELKHVENRRRYNRRYSEGAFTYPYRVISMGRDNARSLSADIPLEQDLYLPEKSELVKFAEVLKESGSSTANLNNRSGQLPRKKTVSLGSLDAFRQSASE